MSWKVEFHKDVDPEFDALAEGVRNELSAHALLLEQFGPRLGRPRVDTLKGSRHANMKELRFDAAGGVCEKRFYRRIIAKADERFDEHLSQTKKKGS